MITNKKDDLGWWDFPDTQKVEINGIEQEFPELTEENFWTLVEDYNKLIKHYNDTVGSLMKEIEDLKDHK